METSFLEIISLKIETKTNWTRNATHQTTTSLHQEWGKAVLSSLANLVTF